MPTRTWVFDLTTGQWHERASHEAPRWRASQSVKAFGRWLVGDTASPGLLEVSEKAFDEVGAPLRFRVESLPAQAFPQRIAVPRADFDFTVGVGRLSADPTVLDPRALISWSDDGGSRWSNPLARSLGRQGETRTRLTLLRTGMTGSQGRIWRIDVSDPVYCALLGGAAALDPRTE